MHYDRTVIGYHGCEERFAKRLLHGHAQLKPSQNDYDWLGHGIYFWEFGAQRAYEWAERKHSRTGRPAVIGALIQLGRCFDLLDTRFTSDLREAFGYYRKAMRKRGWPLPSNDGKRPDRLLRRLDCAVLNWYLELAKEEAQTYQTVRCAFAEGGPVFKGAGMKDKSHIQLAVRDRSCILGVFRPIV